MASKKSSMIFKVLIGFVLGIIFGFVIGPQVTPQNALGVYVMPTLDVIGRVFIRLLQMLIIPLVLSSLLVGSASLGDVRTLGRIGGKTLFWYALTTVFAIAIGLTFANYVHPGAGLSVEGVTGQAREGKPFLDVLLGLIPGYPLRDTSVVPYTAMSAINEGNMLQIIILALFLGVSASLVGEKAKPLVDFAIGLSETMYGLTAIVLKFAPYGVFALIAHTAARFGLAVLMPFAKVILCVYVGVLIHAFVVYSGMISIFARKSPIWFFRGVSETALTAYVTRSSSGTLPITIENARVNLGVPSNIAAFVLPLGATVNMNGTALYQGVCAMFVAQAYGLDLTIAQQFSVIATASLAAVGTAGVPGAGLIMLTMVLTSVGLPIEGVGLVAGIDVILDMARTCINVVGDQAVACVVAASEGAYKKES